MNELIVWIILHLGCWSLMLLAAGGLGHIFLRKYQFNSFVERLVFSLSLGLGLWALLIFVLGISRLLYTNLIFGLTVAAALGTALYLLLWRKAYRSIRFPGWKTFSSLHGIASFLLVLLVIVYCGFLLLFTMYPPVQWDAISHHLVLCREYLAAHRIYAVMGIPFPVLPALNHTLFTWGLALQDEIAAHIIEHTFMMLTALGLYSWGKRRQKPLLGLAAAAFWLGSPLILWLGQAAYVDLCLVSFVFLGVYALRVFSEQKETGWWYLALALLGFGAGVKLPGLFFVIGGGVMGLWLILKPYILGKFSARQHQQKELEPAEEGQSPFTFMVFLRGCILASLFLLPWYIFIFYYTGNPIWPTFPQYSRGVWGAPAVVANTNNWIVNAAEPRTLVNFLLLSLDWIRDPLRFYAEANQSLFPLIIIWPVAWIVAFWNRNVRWWALWAFSFTVYWFLFPHQLRYWLSALPMACLALYESINWLMEKISKSAVLHGAVWVTLTLAAIAWAGKGFPEQIHGKGVPPTDTKTREIYLSSLIGYDAVKYINKQSDRSETICVVGPSYLNYYLKPQILDAFALLQSDRLPTFEWPKDEKWVEWLDSQNASWILINYASSPDYLKIPKQNIVLNPIWPDFDLVYADSQSWVFRHKPLPPEKF